MFVTGFFCAFSCGRCEKCQQALRMNWVRVGSDLRERTGHVRRGRRVAEQAGDGDTGQASTNSFTLEFTQDDQTQPALA